MSPQTLRKAVVLAAGKGTRMKELTRDLPKPMLPVQGRPILDHILEGLAQTGFREVCIVTRYRAEVVEAHVGDGTRLGLAVTCRRQGELPGTGKAVEPARDFVGSDPFLLTYGDILVRPHTYRRVVERFQSGAYDGLVTVTRGEDVRKGGLLFFDEAFCLRRVEEKPDEARLARLQAEGWLRPGDPAWYNAGIYVFGPAVFDHIGRLQPSPRGEYELTDAITALIADGARIAGLEIEDRWVDVRDPETLRQLEQGLL
ncbi:MAG: nucleotidyltransferase family protein [Verrucomicrobia bacterium]|nr:MAG: nucleotidyltransferase family protein [Verrucomicrobiota bacterium]